jgi:hypothetical protein
MLKLIYVIVGLAVPLAACGSSAGSKSAGGGSRSYASFLRFATCMRAHGVPGFPDPSPGGGGVHIGPNTGINPQSPAVQSAFVTCKKQLPGGGPKTTQLTESMKLRALRFARCMRAHGVPNFPDPGSGAGPVQQAIPDINSPSVQRAIRARGGGRNGRF